ncbi:NfeD family protein [Porphyromonadaceae bacterium W3.11]|nr:NfeD family protein [Porphyromonadaceae bacterium W3.11]
METLEIILMILGAIVIVGLLLGEIFFIPGIGLLGIVGVLGFLGVGAYLISLGEYTIAIIFGAVCVLLFVLGFVLLSRNKFIKKVALTDSVNEVAVKLPEEWREGARGVTVSRLTLSGEVQIDGKRYEAESESGFINEGEPVYISRIRKDRIFVKRVEE